MRTIRSTTRFILLAAFAIFTSCGRSSSTSSTVANDPNVTTRGTIEVTARLAEIPEGAIFKRDLYNYATILKYEVLRVHRGALDSKIIYVGHYNPWKPAQRSGGPTSGGAGWQLAAV